MILVARESAFKIFYYVVTADRSVTPDESKQLDEIGVQIFGEDYPEYRSGLIAECENKTSSLPHDPEEAFDVLSEFTEQALLDTVEDIEQGVSARQLMWNLLLIAHSDSNFDQTEKRLLKKINRKLEMGDSILFEMEQYISTVHTIETELVRLKDSMEPYKVVRPVVDELENRLDMIRQAVVALINDEILVPVEKLTVQDDVIDKAQAAIKSKTDPVRQKINEQAGRVLGDVKKAAAPAAAEAGKKLGKAFMGFGSKLIGKQKSSDDEE